MKTLLVVVGARPNFVKVARFREAADRTGFRLVLVHTGQHRDPGMADVFMDQFHLRPDHHLDPGTGGPNEQLARIMLGLGPVIEREAPAAVVVVGDVTSTLAGALTANKMHVPLIHVESGLRSGDRSMPEEVNRILTDRLADLFFVTEPSGVEHLQREGVEADRIHFVGNTMIDTLVAYRDRIANDPILEANGWQGGHALLTMHRPAAVDRAQDAALTAELIEAIAERRPTIFPMHPRTRSGLEASGRLAHLETLPGLRITAPLDYFAFQRVLATADFVVTDSGGVQEETTYCGVPCLTLRPNTERPITVEQGTNELLPFAVDPLDRAIDRILAGGHKKGRLPEKWDGRATERIFQILSSTL